MENRQIYGGYFSIQRKIVNNWIYPSNQNRKFSEFEAWIEMIRLAKFVCVKKEIQGRLIVLPRGYFDTTVTQLAEIFSWNRKTVEKFLKILEKDNMIKRYKLNPKSLKSVSIIKINNYNSLQPSIYENCKSPYREKCGLNCKIKEKKAQFDNDFYMRLSR